MKRKNGILYTLLIALLAYTVLTWILPVTTYSGDFADQGMVRIGLSELLSYPTYTFYNFIYIFVYLALICCLYGILRKIPAYRHFVSKLVDKYKKNEFIYNIVLILLFAVIVSFTGFTYEAMAIMPFIATIMLKAGKDKFSAGLVTIGSIAVGVMGNIFSSIIAGTFVGSLAIEYTSLLIPKLLFLLGGVAALVVTLKMHSKKEEKEENDDVFFLYEEEKDDKKAKVWPIATLLGLVLLIKVLAGINWSDALGATFFTDLKTKFDEVALFSKYIAFIVFGLTLVGLLVKYILKKRKNAKTKFREAIGKVGFVFFIISCVVLGVVFIKVIFEDVLKVTTILTKFYETLSLDGITLGTLFGSVNPFGAWTYAEYIILTMVLCIALMIGYRVKPNEMVENAGFGLRGGLYALILCMLGYVMLVTSSNNPIMLTILKPLMTLTKGFNVLTYSIVTFISGLFNTDFQYINYNIVNLTYVTGAYGDKANLFPLIALINQSMFGLAMLVAPTSVPMIFGLTTLNMSYKKWIKNIWKLFLTLFIITLLINVIVLILI